MITIIFGAVYLAVAYVFYCLARVGSISDGD